MAALPPTVDPSWFGLATIAMNDIAPLRWIGRGLRRLAAIFGVKPLYAPPGAGWDFTRMSDFQIALVPVMDHNSTGTPCGTPAPHCLNLGTSSGAVPVPVSVKVSAPDSLGPHTFPADHFPVQDTRLHFFPSTGTVACAGSPAPGSVCVPASLPDNSTTPASTWDHLVVVTGTDGKGSVDWTLVAGDNTLNVLACGVARPGTNEPNPPDTIGDGVWGTLTPGACSNRSISATGFDNGPADGFTPFEPVDTDNEVAIYGLPLRFEATRTEGPATVLVIDDESIAIGAEPNSFSKRDVNGHKADIGLRAELPFFARNVGSGITLYTGEVGDEGWFALTTIPGSWDAAGPTGDGLRNYIEAGPGLGSGADREALLDQIPGVTPLRATGLKLLEGQAVCAVVYNGDVSVNYDPLTGSLKGENLGIVAFEVQSVTQLTGFTASSLPKVQIKILNADAVCERVLTLFEDAPEPISSSEPFDVTP